MSKNTKITGGRKTIILKDEDVLEMINEIARLPDYEGNFNKIMNHAIKFGIVTLYERIFDGRAIDEVKDIVKPTIKEIEKSLKEKQIEDYMEEMLTLMKENIVYQSVIKSIVSSTYNIKEEEVENGFVSSTDIKEGNFRRTPKYIEMFERRALKNVRGDC